MTETDEGLEEYKKLAWAYAMQYLQLGWSIIPIRLQGDKKPALEWKEYQERQPSEDEVTSWFEDGVPDGNGGLTKVFGLAVITGAISGLVVTDCDNQDALTYAVAESGLFSMLNVKTTRGQHLYFKHPGAGKVGNKVGGQGRDWPDVHGLDLRGDGGYVVAPPTLKFNEDGSFRHQYAFNVPMGELENFVSSLTTWPGIKQKVSVAPIAPEEWSFDKLNLSSIQSHGADVWNEMSAKVKAMGRKMVDGDGRNLWLVRYLGECIATGMDEGQARSAGDQFQEEFYETPLPTAESETVLQSVISTDKRNHPEKYEQREKYDNKNPQRQARAAALRLIRPGNLGELRKLSEGDDYLITPFVPPKSIIQVVGFNGHGKSLWLLNMLWAAASGRSFGSAYCGKPVRSLYLDFEGSSNTITTRVDACEQMIGPMADSLTIWNASVAGDDMCLNDAEALTRLAGIINEVKPQLVVIDTVRQAWAGMEENSPHSWHKVNQIAMTCRNEGMSVILVHHRNKPNMQGHGREAGSTAQLKDLDVQIIVTKVVTDPDQAKREAAMPDSATLVSDSTGATSTAWTYLRRTLPPSFILKVVFELSFGKLRQATENHVPTYVGLAEDKQTGEWRTVSSLTPMQKAFALHHRGVSPSEISEKLGVSQPTVKGWFKHQQNGV